jgi:1-acyl-sn-glycerol-3-phosphate acyltransferase
MGRGTKRALLFGAVPFLTLVLALPFVNRVEPLVFGLPFVLFWILLWVALTPVALFLAYRVEKKYNPPEPDPDSEPAPLPAKPDEERR